MDPNHGLVSHGLLHKACASVSFDFAHCCHKYLQTLSGTWKSAECLRVWHCESLFLSDGEVLHLCHPAPQRHPCYEHFSNRIHRSSCGHLSQLLFVGLHAFGHNMYLSSLPCFFLRSLSLVKKTLRPPLHAHIVSMRHLYVHLFRSSSLGIQVQIFHFSEEHRCAYCDNTCTSFTKMRCNTHCSPITCMIFLSHCIIAVLIVSQLRLYAFQCHICSYRLFSLLQRHLRTYPTRA